MLRKKGSLLLILLAFTTIFVFANGSQETGESAKANEPVEISLWHYFTSHDGAVFKQVLDNYNSSQSAIQIKYEMIPRDELIKQYTIGVVGGNLPDIGMVDNPNQASFIEMGLYKDITDLVNEWGKKDQYFDGPMLSTIQNDRVYGLPHNSNCLSLWYDVDVLKAAGVQPPTTWDELEKVCEAVSSDEMYALAISAVKNEEGTFQYLPWLLSAGADIEHLDSPESIAALSFLTGLIEKGYMSPEIINWTQADIEKQFATGKAAMMINGPWNIANVKTDAPEKNWACVKIPMKEQYSSVLGGENFGIISTIEDSKLEAAWEALKYICYDTSEEFNIAGGKFSPRSDVMSKSNHWKSDPILAVFAEQMQYAMPRGPHPKWPEISSAICISMHEAFTGLKTPNQACIDAAAVVSKALK